jgi:protein gp37
MSTKIEWARDADGTKGKVWNAMSGCSYASIGCRHCYAERMSHRLAGRFGYPKDQPFSVTLHPDKLGEPLRWTKGHRVFVCSMGDLFHEDMPFDYIAAVFGVMASTPQHQFMVLTKRPERMLEWFEWVENPQVDGVAMFPENSGEWRVRQLLASSAWKFGVQVPCHHDGWPLPNVALGTTVENHEYAKRRIPSLLRCLSVIRFVSVEPMLGPVWLDHLDVDGAGNGQWCQIDALTGRHTDMGRPCADVPKLDWVICGGESGPGARSMEITWARELRDKCKAAGVPFFMKQLGSYIASFGLVLDPSGTRGMFNHTKGGDPAEWPEDLRVRQTPWDQPPENAGP